DQIVPFVSSIFLRRLLQPGIYQNATLRATAHDYNKLWSDFEFQSLTVDGLKKEIFFLIEGMELYVVSNLCISNIHQQLGKAVSAIFYESLVNAQLLSSVEVFPGFLKILETGYSSSVAKLHVSQFGADTAWKKELEDRRNQRKFSIEMLLSLNALLDKAASCDRILNVIEHFIKFLVPYKRSQSFDAEAVFNINSSALILSTSQVARVMFESAFDILLLLGYLVNVRGQIHMMYNDISWIQHELIPMIQETLTEDGWTEHLVKSVNIPKIRVRDNELIHMGDKLIGIQQETRLVKENSKLTCKPWKARRTISPESILEVMVKAKITDINLFECISEPLEIVRDEDGMNPRETRFDFINQVVVENSRSVEKGEGEQPDATEGVQSKANLDLLLKIRNGSPEELTKGFGGQLCYSFGLSIGDYQQSLWYCVEENNATNFS
ncbi:Nuclear pore complex protein, partial [Thalictrum thalictroides]